MYLYVKSAVEKIKKWVSGKIDNLASEDVYVPVSERKKPWILAKWLLFAGNIYHFYKTRQEHFNVFIYNFHSGFANVQIMYEIGKHSRKLLFLILLTFALPSSIYFILQQQITFTLSSGAIKNLLLAYFAGTTTLLGIIFALYSVGFQIATSKFSSEVTDYINQEKVGKFFFSLLVIAGIFSLLTLIAQYGLGFALIIPFIIATFLVTFSLLGILIYKDDYITKLKPKSIFSQIYHENIKAIRQVNEYHVPRIRNFAVTRNLNITSFLLHLMTRDSWSIVMTHQKNVERRLKIHSVLFRDLVRENSFDDASYGIAVLGYLLDAYIEVKHFIDTDRPWWFPTYQDIVSADDMSMFPLKANYESRGIGRLGVTKSNFTWLEDVILGQLEAVQNDEELMKQPKIANALINAYKTILAGRFERTKLGMEKTVRGICELQDFDLSERVYKLFFSLGEKITDESVKANYINTLGEIKTVAADGFSLRTFPGRLEEWGPKFKTDISYLLQNGKMPKDNQELVALKLPKYFYILLSDYLERLKVEEFAERKIVTPEAWLTDELLETAVAKEKEVREKFLFALLDGMFKLWEQSTDVVLKNNFNVIIFGLFNQLISANEWDFLEKIITKYKVKLFMLLLQVDTNNFIELELREPIEFGVFNALVARKKVPFDFYASMFFMTQIHLNSKIDQNDMTQVLKLARRPMMLGALAYVVSELDDDFHYVNTVTEMAESLFSKADLGTIFELTKDMKVGLGTSTLYQIIYEEANRYRPYYRDVINSIFDLPPDWITHGGPPFGMSSTQTVRHKSSFIRDLASFRLADMEECFDGYVEWLKKREQIKKLLTTLSAIKK